MNSLLLGLACLIPFATVAAAQGPDPAAIVAAKSLAPGGTLRAALNFGNPVLVQRDPAGGPPHGISPDLARELGRRLGVPVQFVPYEGAGSVTAAAKRDEWDVCFMAIDPLRAEGVDFTAPYVMIEGGYLVPDGSPLQAVDEVDRDGVAIMGDHGAAYVLYLQRALKHAHLVYPPDGQRSTAYYFSHPDPSVVLANVRQPLATLAAQHPGYRVLPGRFMEIKQAMGTTAGRAEGLAYLRAFVDDVIASGFVARGLEASGQDPVLVARP